MKMLFALTAMDQHCVVTKHPQLKINICTHTYYWAYGKDCRNVNLPKRLEENVLIDLIKFHARKTFVAL